MFLLAAAGIGFVGRPLGPPASSTSRNSCGLLGAAPA
jgi:hypothetical protein